MRGFILKFPKRNWYFVLRDLTGFYTEGVWLQTVKPKIREAPQQQMTPHS